MHVLSLLTNLRSELNLAEQVTVQAWECYAQNLSEVSLAAAVDATRCVMALHQQIASRLEQLVRPTAVAEASRALQEHRTPSAA
ncbi:MAG: hypothetical protein AB7N91_05010 [Candidatus Tectimicrobiota bacterium]